MALLAGMLTGLSSCATLNTASMSEPCRNQYNACLDNCQPPGPASNRIPEGPPPNGPNVGELDFDTPSCVLDCNEQAKRCT
jgi:hypothetical protein